MTVGQLRVALDHVPDDLPVIVKWDEGDATVILDAAVATKQGMSFRIYPDPASRRVIGPTEGSV